MKPELNFLEKIFTIFSLLFFSNVLGLNSLFIEPDSVLNGSYTYNPLDPLLSLIQYGIHTIALFLIIARWRSSMRFVLRDPLVWLLTGLALMSFLWSDFPDLSLRKGITTLQTTAFGLYLASRYSLKQQLQLLAWALWIIAILTLLFTLAFPGAGIESSVNAGSWRGPFAQKNLLAHLMVLSALVFLLLALDNYRQRYLMWAGFSVSVLLIVLSGSKTALVILLTIILLLPAYKALRWSDTLVIPLVISLILVSGSIAVVVIGNWENILLGLGRETSLSGRTDLWELSFEMIRKRPWLGYGYQAFWQNGGGAEVIWQAVEYKPPHAHDGYIDITLDLGLIGLCLFLLIILVNYIRALPLARSGQTSIALWPIYHVTFFFLYNYTENTIIEHNSIFWVLLVAASLSLPRAREINSEQLEPKHLW